MSTILNIFERIQTNQTFDNRDIRSLFAKMSDEKKAVEEVFSAFVSIMKSLQSSKVLFKRNHVLIYEKFLEKYLYFIIDKKKQLNFLTKILSFFIEHFQTSFLQIQWFCSRQISNLHIKNLSSNINFKVKTLEILKEKNLLEMVTKEFVDQALSLSLYLIFQKNFLKKQGIILGSLLF